MLAVQVAVHATWFHPASFYDAESRSLAPEMMSTLRSPAGRFPFGCFEPGKYYERLIHLCWDCKALLDYSSKWKESSLFRCTGILVAVQWTTDAEDHDVDPGRYVVDAAVGSRQTTILLQYHPFCFNSLYLKTIGTKPFYSTMTASLSVVLLATIGHAIAQLTGRGFPNCENGPLSKIKVCDISAGMATPR